MFDINEIKQQFSDVIKFSQGIKEPQIDELFNNWYKAKKKFIDAMNGELRICVPNVKFDLGEKERERRLESFLNHLDEDYDLYNLVSFLSGNRKGFFNNEVVFIPCWMYVNDDVENGVIRDSYKGIQLGMKLIRCFKYFIYDKTFLEQVQNEASMIIQEDKIEGNLYLSVHPLDFLSSSENTYNWRSCHALDGEYRCGNLSYMCDETTMISFIATEDKVLPRFPQDVKWNSKKWRMLLFFSSNWDMIFAGRQYPFFSRGIMDYILNTVIANNSKLSDKRYWWSPWSNAYIDQVEDIENDETLTLYERYIPISAELRTMKSIVKDAKGSKHFNDLLNSSYYIPYYTKRRQRDPFDEVFDKVYLRELIFNVGSQTKCLHCGTHIVDDYNMMVCMKCDIKYYHFNNEDEYVQCEICGTYIGGDFAYTNAYGQYVCEDCYNNEHIKCERCGEHCFNDDIVYDERFENNICRWCNEEITFDD